VIGEVIDDGEGGHREDAAFSHQPHGFVAQLIGMVDRRHAGARRIERARLTVACTAIRLPTRAASATAAESSASVYWYGVANLPLASVSCPVS